VSPSARARSRLTSMSRSQSADARRIGSAAVTGIAPRLMAATLALKLFSANLLTTASLAGAQAARRPHRRPPSCRAR
jgi:hypothetical protein